MFIIFSGLPGVGKTTIAKKLTTRLDATYLRVDTIEQAVRKIEKRDREPLPTIGYTIAFDLAKENLLLGSIVIVDSVNSIHQTRNMYKEIAISAKSPFIEIEVICSDKQQHRERIENRKSDLKLKNLTWDDVVNRHYEPWNREHLTLDTSKLSIEQSIQEILQALNI